MRKNRFYFLKVVPKNKNLKEIKMPQTCKVIHIIIIELTAYVKLSPFWKVPKFNNGMDQGYGLGWNPEQFTSPFRGAIISSPTSRALVSQYIASMHCRILLLLPHLELYDQHQYLPEQINTTSVMVKGIVKLSISHLLLINIDHDDIKQSIAEYLLILTTFLHFSGYFFLSFQTSGRGFCS